MMDQPGNTDLNALRQARNREYLQEVLQDPHPLQANIGAVQADLFDVASQLKQGIDRALADGTDVKELAPSLATWLNVHRQVARFLPYSGRFPAD